MQSAPSWTKWRDEPVLPGGYEDIAALVKTARRARGRAVEFDLGFQEKDLRRLRDTVHHWGISGVVGRYKCFDARVLSAINAALGEPNTIFVLNEPKNAKDLDCRVSCEAKDGEFRLRGHGPFDVVFGLGQGAVSDDPETRVRLGEVAAATVATAVNQLGWDLDRLNMERMSPVTNTLYGNRVDYGMEGREPPTGPAEDVSVHFLGPFTATDEPGQRCLFTDKVAALSLDFP